MQDHLRAGSAALLSALFLGTGAPARAQDAAALAVPAPLELAWCLDRAERANPALAAQAAESEAALARVRPAAALDDPRLAYELSNVPRDDRDLRSTPLSGQQLGLRQKLPFPGTLSSREAAAQAGARAAARGLDDRRIFVASAVEQVWTELGFAQRAIEITDRNLDLLRQLARVAETKYRVGGGLQQDVLRAQVELTALLERRLQRTADVERSSAHLTALLELPPATVLPRTGSLEDAAPLPDVQTLLGGLEQGSPRLRSAAARIEQAREQVRVAELEGYPDFDLGLGYRIRERVAGDLVEGDDFLSAGVTIRLPLDRGRWRARVVEQRALLRREQAQYRALRAELAAGIRSALAELRRAESEVELLETGLVPQARQSLDSSRSGYEVGRIDFLALLDSQVRLLDAELRRVRALADRRQAFAALEHAAGEKLR
jgi:outer membrane protein TolC